MGALTASRQRVAMEASVRANSSHGFTAAPARLGDHLAIHQLLRQVFGGPSLHEFQAQQDEPGYNPALRFVIRHESRVVGHVRLVPGIMLLGGGFLSAARLCDWAVAQEYRGRGWGRVLLEAAEQHAAAQGVGLLFARSSQESQFFGRGWFPGGHFLHSSAGPRDILAEIDRRRHLRAQQHTIALPRKHGLGEVSVRRWRQTEHAAIQRLYREAMADMPGPLVRNDAQWRWLITREAYDWFHVAISGPDRGELNDVQSHIVGYMFLKGNRIVECVHAPGREDAARALLTRACRDAIEHSAEPVRIDAPQSHMLHEMFLASGGTQRRRECEAGQWRLAKVLDWPRFIAARQPRSEPQEPCSLEIVFEHNERRWFVGDATGARLQAACPTERAKADATCSHHTFAQLWLGHRTYEEALNAGLLVAQTNRALCLREWLPNQALWLPPFDELLA